MTCFIAVILEGRNLANYVDELERTKEHFCRLGIMVISDSSLNEKVEVIWNETDCWAVQPWLVWYRKMVFDNEEAAPN